MEGVSAVVLIFKYKEQLLKDANLFSFAQESFSIEHATYEGLCQEDLRNLVNHYHQMGSHSIAQILETLVLAGDRSHTGTRTAEGKNFKQVLVMYERRADDLYNILVGCAEQRRELNWKKIGIAGVGSSGVGFGVGALAWAAGVSNPITCGVVAGVMMFSGAGAKAAIDLSAEANSVVLGFLLDRLENFGLVAIEDRVVRIRMPN